MYSWYNVNNSKILIDSLNTAQLVEAVVYKDCISADG